MLPGVPKEVFRVIEEKAAIDFNVIYFVSPQVLRAIFLRIKRNYRYRMADVTLIERVMSAFNLVKVEQDVETTDREVQVHIPPKDLMDIVNNPQLNGDGTHEFIGLHREFLLSATSDLQAGLLVAASFDMASRSEIQDVLTYMCITRPQFVNVVERLGDWIHSWDLKDFKTTDDRPLPALGRLFQHNAMHRHDTIVSGLRSKLSEDKDAGADDGERSSVAYAARVQPQKILRYPADWKYTPSTAGNASETPSTAGNAAETTHEKPTPKPPQRPFLSCLFCRGRQPVEPPAGQDEH